MRSAVIATALVLAVGGAAQGQPPGGADFFGAGAGQAFDEGAIFKKPPPGIVVPKPITIPDGSPPPPPPPKIWTGGLEFGLNGSQSDVDILNIKLGAQADRKTDRNTFHTDFLYSLNTRNGDVSQNQALLNARDEILFKDTPCSVFSALQLEYDELRTFDLRVGLYAGLGYVWVDDDATLFKTRVGAGAVREMNIERGGPADRWVPEAVLGFDFNHQFTERQGFVSSLDVYPSLSQFGQYRVRSRAAYEILLDPTHGMVLRLGIQDRYDSHPGSGPRNSLNYFATLLFKF